MARIVIWLSPDRAKSGALTLEDDEGQTLSGPFPVSGRASDEPAREHQNESRNPLMRYGDTPTGTYRVSGILKSGDGTAYSLRQYGSNGVIVLDPVSGDAALADANGRYHVFIQGGTAGRSRKLRSTNGCLRLLDGDQAKLVDAIRDLGGLSCDCIEDPTIAENGTVLIDNSYNEGDPPATPGHDAEGVPVRQMKFSRRAVLRGAAIGAAATAMQTISLGHRIFVTRDGRGRNDSLGFEGVAMAYPPSAEATSNETSQDTGEESESDNAASISRSPASSQPIVPKPDTISDVRRLHEPLPPDELSVRDQAIDRTAKVIENDRGISEGDIKVNSLFRLDSNAHMRGAFDMGVQGSKDPSKEAGDISQSLGPGFIVIYEVPDKAAGTQTNVEFFSDGSSKTKTGKSGTPEFHADGPHIHVQPDKKLFEKKDK